ncbi:MAG: RNase adapter RapZ [Gammaproteobacteria bacterium]|nr:RNase adapter RapZ [Gammaproteobacteria bacterium]
MRLIIISGRSGSGKSTALHQLEDEGYYCIDNLPVTLLPGLVHGAQRSGITTTGIAVCIDARNTWKDLEHFPNLLDSLPAAVQIDILYLDADAGALIKRFSETRRRHPLSDESTPLAEAIERERDILEPIASAASLTIDTSQMTIYELRSAIRQRLLGNRAGEMSILFQSFGFKRGLPNDADLVYDLRMLPNPHWERALRLKTGRDPEVISFLQQEPMVEDFYADVCEFLEKWMPRYRDNSRSYLTIALGCTGGQHRSVYLAERLYNHYKERYSQVHIRHREL